MDPERIQARFDLRYPEFSLDVDLDLPGRGVTALFGHSGSGKTTLLRCIAGLERPPQGRLWMKGEVWQDAQRFVPTHRRPVGYVFQEASLFPHLSARGNLEYGRRRAARPLDQAALDHVTELLGIGPLLDRRPDQLSGRRAPARGRRPGLGGGAAPLMDEPLALWDVKRKQEILPYLERLRDELSIPFGLDASHAHEVADAPADHRGARGAPWSRAR